VLFLGRERQKVEINMIEIEFSYCCLLHFAFLGVIALLLHSVTYTSTKHASSMSTLASQLLKC
jgi:hypothetical protein